MRLTLVILLLLLPVSASAQVTGRFSVADWVDTAATGAPSYINGELVKFNGTVWVCNTGTPPTSSSCPNSPAVNPQWNALGGLLMWNDSTTYPPNRMVMRNGTMFTAIRQNLNKDPSAGAHPDDWRSRGVTVQPSTFLDASTFDNVGGTCGTDMGCRIQAAHDSSQCASGCEIWVPFGAYSGTSTVSITKSVTIRGAGTNLRVAGQTGGGTFGAGTVLTGPGTIFAINTPSPVVIRELVVEGSGSIITLTGTPSNASSGFYEVGFHGGAVGIVGTNARLVNVVNSVFSGQSTTAVDFSFASNPDDGAIQLINNFMEGASGSTAIQITDASSVTIIGNATITWNTTLNIVSSISGSHSQYQIIGNQFAPASGGSTPKAIVITVSGSGGLASVEIAGNFIDCESGTAASATGCVRLDGSGSFLANLVFTGNAVRASTIGGSGGVLANNLVGAVFSGNNISANSTNASSYLFNITSSTQTLVTGNTMTNVATPNPYQGSAYFLQATAEAALPLTLASLNAVTGLVSGSTAICTDCKRTGDGGFAAGTCASGGSGNLATLWGGTWKCQATN